MYRKFNMTEIFFYIVHFSIDLNTALAERDTAGHGSRGGFAHKPMPSLTTGVCCKHRPSVRRRDQTTLHWHGRLYFWFEFFFIALPCRRGEESTAVTDSTAAATTFHSGFVRHKSGQKDKSATATGVT
jgi:hypothetical protein